MTLRSTSWPPSLCFRVCVPPLHSNSLAMAGRTEVTPNKTVYGVSFVKDFWVGRIIVTEVGMRLLFRIRPSTIFPPSFVKSAY